jgi:hypothetical protein
VAKLQTRHGSASPSDGVDRSLDISRRSSVHSEQSTFGLGYDSEPGSLAPAVTKKIFPYHVMVDRNFEITSVGKDLPRLLHQPEDAIVGTRIDHCLCIAKPSNAEWTWPWLRKLEDQEFSVEINDDDMADISFKASVVFACDSVDCNAMIIMSPDAKNLDELRGMQLTLSDLPLHGAYRDAVFLREHLSTQMNNALKMEKMSRTLEREKALLEELLPEHAAAGLREGRTVEPMVHPNVTMFFSDIVGFTDICKRLYPWEVIAMLNRLYSVMDYLAKKFSLFKGMCLFVFAILKCALPFSLFLIMSHIHALDYSKSGDYRRCLCLLLWPPYCQREAC